MAPDVPKDTVALPNGGAMPLLGFGTWKLTGREAVTSTAMALETGYRHLDTATIYRNEAEVGRGLRDSGVPRADVFVTTKARPERAGRERETLEQSLEALGTDRVDLWLVHAPPSSAGERKSMWEAFVRAQEDGLARDIGVSNFSLDQVDELHDATGVKPAVNQIEWSPLLFDADVLDGHRARDVVLEGYSGLRGGTLDEPTVTGIADRLGRTPAQVVIRWHLQHGTVVIPKSSKPDRIRSNAEVDGFELSDQDMAALDALGR
jgi:diketogulonate reductase-like aldo/keto reductase